MKHEVTMTISITTSVDVESDENWRDACDYLLEDFLFEKYPLDKFKDNDVYFSSNIGGKHYFKGKKK
jgi:hypothetical protein|tara:strand:+ start:3271 stop:3471 length:201 start_codon:yes stop_codon:yes gene_type:complete